MLIKVGCKQFMPIRTTVFHFFLYFSSPTLSSVLQMYVCLYICVFTCVYIIDSARKSQWSFCLLPSHSSTVTLEHSHAWILHGYWGWELMSLCCIASAVTHLGIFQSLFSLYSGFLSNHETFYSWLSSYLGVREKSIWMWSLKIPSAEEPWNTLTLQSPDTPC